MAYKTKILSVGEVVGGVFNITVEFKDDANILPTFESIYPIDLENYPTKDAVLEMLKSHKKSLNKQNKTIVNLKQDLESEVGK